MSTSRHATAGILLAAQMGLFSTPAAVAQICGLPSGNTVTERACIGGTVQQGENPLVVPGKAIGNQRLLVILARLSADTIEPPIKAVEQRLFFARDSLDTYFREVSFGHIRFDPATAHILTGLPPFSDADSDVAVRAQAIQAAEPLVDLQQFDRVLVVYQAPESGPFISMGSYGKREFACDGGVQLGVASDSTNLSERGVAEHEIMHTLGTGHARVLACPDTIGTACQDLSPDSSDLMGHQTTRRHVSAVIKERHGWLTAANVVEVAAAGGSYRLTASELAAPDAVQVIKIHRRSGDACVRTANGDFDDGWYYIEYRAPIGSDAVPVPLERGVQVRLAGTRILQPQLLSIDSADPLRRLEHGTLRPGQAVLLDGEQPVFLHVGAIDLATESVAVRLEPFAIEWPGATLAAPPGQLLAVRLPGRRVAGPGLAFALRRAPADAALWQLGDVNQDGVIDVYDYTTLASWASGDTRPERDEQTALADVDGDGAITFDDAVALQSGAVADSRLFLWRPAGNLCGPYAVAIDVDNGGEPLSRTLIVNVGPMRVVRPAPGERVFGTVDVLVEAGCSEVSWGVEGEPLLPMRSIGDGVWRAEWGTELVADADDVGLLFNTGGPDSLRSSVVVDNAEPLLHLEHARVRNLSGRASQMLVVGRLELPDFDPMAGDGLTFIAGPPVFKNSFFPLTCSSPDRCSALMSPGVHGLHRISLWRAGAGWRFVLQVFDTFGALPPELALNIQFCGGAFFNPLCLGGSYPFSSLGGSTRRYRAPTVRSRGAGIAAHAVTR